MSPVSASLLFYAYVVGICEISRIAIRQTVKNLQLKVFLLEVASTLQLCACVFEGPLIYKYFGLVGLWIVWFCLATIHGYTALAAGNANPLPVLENAVSRSMSPKLLVLKLTAQVLAAYLTLYATMAFWSLEMSADHAAQYASYTCKFQYKLPWVLIGLTELVLICIQKMAFMELALWRDSVPTRLAKAAVTATLLATGTALNGPTFLNPAQGLGRFFACSGIYLKDHLILHWLFPAAGWLIGAYAFAPIRTTLLGKKKQTKVGAAAERKTQ